MTPFQSSASPPPQKPPPTVTGVLWQLASLIFKREAIMIAAAVVVLLGAGASSMVYAQSWVAERVDAGIEERVSPLEKRTEALEVAVIEIKKDTAAANRQSANAERTSLEGAINIRLVAAALNVKPVTIEAKDGGM